MKLHYSIYPVNGFGSRNNQYYLIDSLGNRFDIVSVYDEVMNETFYEVEDEQGFLRDSGYDLSSYTADSPLALIERLNDIEGIEITEW